MKKRFTSLMALMAMFLYAGNVWAQTSPWVGAAVENGQTYYIYNVKAQKFLNGGNSWGTQASLADDGAPFIAEGGDGVYALNGVVANNATDHYLGTGGFIDAPSANLTLTEVSEGIYTIGWGGNYYAAPASGTIVEIVTSVSDACYWQFVTRDGIVASAANATKDAPMNLTSLIHCANFGRHNTDASYWTGSPALGGDNPNFCAEKWNAGIVEVSQALTGLPEGVYKLQAQAFYRLGTVEGAAAARAAGTENYDVQLFAADQSMQVMSVMEEAGKVSGVGAAYGTYGTAPNSMWDASQFFTAGYYDHALYFTVGADGAATIGVKKVTSVDADWLIFDNFRLTYYGNSAEAKAYGAAFIKEQMAVRFAELETLRTSVAAWAEALDATAYSEGTFAAIDAALEEAAYVAENGTTGVEIDQAMNALNAVKTLVAKIDELTPLLAEVDALEGDYSEGTLAALDEALKNGYAAKDAGNVEADIVAAIDMLKAVIARAAKNLEINEWYLTSGSSATVDSPVSATAIVTNPSMDNGTINGWDVASGWQFQQNRVYSNGEIKLEKFQERWIWGAGLGDTYSTQKLLDVPNGKYTVSMAVIAADQDGSKATVNGAYFVVNDNKVAIATENEKPELYSAEVFVNDNTLYFGIVTENTTANWLAFDNVVVTYYGPVTIKDKFKDAYDELVELGDNGALAVLAFLKEEMYQPQLDDATAIYNKLDEYDVVEDEAFLAEEIEKIQATIAEVSRLCEIYNEGYLALYNLVNDANSYSHPTEYAYREAIMEALATYGPEGVAAVTGEEDLNVMIGGLREAYFAYMPNAVANEGFKFDVTFMIENPSFETGDLTGWEANDAEDMGVKPNSNGTYTMSNCDGDYLFNTWHGAATYVTQTVSGLPAGVYQMSTFVASDGFTIEVTAGDVTVSNAYDNKPTGYMVVVDSIMHEGGDLVIKVATSNDEGDWAWFKADDFRLYCLGAAKPLVDEAKSEQFLAKYAELVSLVDIYSTLWMIPAASEMFFEVQEAAYAMSEVIEETTVEDADRMIAEMDQVIVYVKAMDAKYNEWKEELFTCYDCQDNTTEVTPEAAATFAEVVDRHSGYQWSMPAATVEEIDALIAELVAAREAFIAVANNINSIDADVETIVYDIHGRRVSTMEKGIYIVNGKKVFVK